MQKQSTKWKNSVRHNLSRHKYFVKTCEKNAQGHYWSIDSAYLSIFKNGNFDEKSIKKAKLTSKFKNKASKGSKNKIKLEKQIQDSSYEISSSSYHTMSSPSTSCKSFNSGMNNDSAYMSGSDYANSSMTGTPTTQQMSSYMSNVAYAEQYCARENFSLQSALCEVFMDSKNDQFEVKKLKRM